MVSYSDEAVTLLSFSEASNRSVAQNRLRSAPLLGGSTNTLAGLKRAQEVFNTKNQTMSAVVLMTDGGTASSKELEEQTMRMFQLRLSLIGVNIGSGNMSAFNPRLYSKSVSVPSYTELFFDERVFNMVSELIACSIPGGVTRVMIFLTRLSTVVLLLRSHSVAAILIALFLLSMGAIFSGLSNNKSDSVSISSEPGLSFIVELFYS